MVPGGVDGGPNQFQRRFAPRPLRRGLAAAEALARQAEADRSLEAWAAAEALELGPLDTADRVVAWALLGADLAPAAAGEGLLARVHGRYRDLRHGSQVLREALDGRLQDRMALERLWQLVLQGQGESALTAGTALALMGLTPLPVREVAQLQQIDRAGLAPLVAVAVGQSARYGSRTGEQLLRGVLSEDASPHSTTRRASAPAPPTLERLGLAALRGVGGGRIGEGLRWLAERASRALDHHEAWLEAAVRALHLALTHRPDLKGTAEVQRLARAVLGAGEEARAAARFDGLAERPAAQPLLGALAASPGWFPSKVRARLLPLAAASAPDGEGHGDDSPWLADRSPEVLQALLQTLTADALETPAAARTLLSAWQHPNSRVRRAAAETLQRQRGTSPPAVSPVATPGAEVVEIPAWSLARAPLDRLYAALWVGESDRLTDLARKIPAHQRSNAIHALVAAIEVPDMGLRRGAIAALAELGAHEASSALLDAARRYRSLEGSVAQALSGIARHPPGGSRRGEAGDDKTPSVAHALGRIFRRRLKWADDEAVADFCDVAGPLAQRWLAAALETRFYPAARAGAARAIARQRHRELVFTLRSHALTDTQEEARLAAQAAMVAVGAPPPSADELAGYALLYRPTDQLDDTVERAVQAGLAALPGLRATLAQGSWKRRCAACRVLAAIDGDETMDVLVGCLEDIDEDVRLAAWDALAGRGFHPSTPEEHTLAALAAREPSRSTGGEGRTSLPTLEAALRLGGHVFRTEVLDALERLPSWQVRPDNAAWVAATRLDPERALREPDGLATLLQALDHTWQAVPHRARLSRPLRARPPEELARCLDRPHAGEPSAAGSHALGWRAREALCHALARPSDAVAADVLAHRLVDEDDDVRRAALEALSRIGGRAAAEALVEGLESPFREDRDAVAHALAAVGAPALPILDELIGDDWWETRRAAAVALKAWRGDRQEAADRLLVLAVDAEFRVALVAREGLEGHGLLPRFQAVRTALRRALSASLSGLEPWLRLDAFGRLTDRAASEALREQLESVSPHQLPARLGLPAIVRAEGLVPWLENLATLASVPMPRDPDPDPASSTDHDHDHDRHHDHHLQGHLGVRLAAADALRRLNHSDCPLCHARSSVACPSCEGEGEVTCRTCDGHGSVDASCPEPDCSAKSPARAIDAPTCKTCRGRGRISVPCPDCVEGVQRCGLCAGTGRLPCPLCTAPPPGLVEDVAAWSAAEPVVGRRQTPGAGNRPSLSRGAAGERAPDEP